MRAFAGFRFSHIHILESLAAGELHTGRILAGFLRTLPDPPDVRFAEFTTREALNERLSEIAGGLAKTREIPIVHIESHGTDDGQGIVPVSGGLVRWKELRAPLEEINANSGLHVLLVLALCSGAQIIELVDPTERAPFWGYVGSDKVVSAGAVEKGFPPFYSTLFATNDLVRATQALKQIEPKFGVLPIEYFFI
jgi:hypothetical protein